MSTATRPRRANPSAVNTPTEIHVLSSTTISREDAETILSEFISTSEAIASTFPASEVLNGNSEYNSTGLSNSGGNNVILGQLKRVQRDLRGLPPLSAEMSSVMGSTETSSNKRIKFDEEGEVEEPKNKKIKFDDDDDVEAEVEAGDENEEVDSEEEEDEEDEEDEEEKEE